MRRIFRQLRYKAVLPECRTQREHLAWQEGVRSAFAFFHITPSYHSNE